MTSKERVRTALAHKTPDRTPTSYYAREEASEAVRNLLGLASAADVEDSLEVDLRRVGPRFKAAVSDKKYADPTIAVRDDGIHLDIWGVGFSPNSTGRGFYMDHSFSPLEQASTIADLDRHAWPKADDWDYSGLTAACGAFPDRYLWAHSRGIFEISWLLRGFNGFLMDLAADPDMANALMDRVQAFLFAKARRTLEAGQGLIDMIEYNDDIGSQQGLLISPDMWRRFIKPRFADFIRMVKKDYGVAVKYHSCGSVRPILGDLIEIGLDVLNPVQTLAKGMEPEGLKRDFGALTFNGGVDTQKLLPEGTADDVRREVRRLIQVLGKNGGLILGPSHKFQADVPAQNIAAIYEEVLGKNLTR